MAESDPKFYKYLVETQPSLLDFDDVKPLNAMGDDEEEAEEAADAGEQQQSAAKRSDTKAARGDGGAAKAAAAKRATAARADGRKEITLARVKGWLHAIDAKQSFTAFKHFLAAFEVACRMKYNAKKNYFQKKNFSLNFYLTTVTKRTRPHN